MERVAVLKVHDMGNACHATSSLIKVVNAMTKQSSRGGDHASHEQHVKAGQQSHKNEGSSSHSKSASSESSRGGSHEQHVKAGQQSHKNDR